MKAVILHGGSGTRLRPLTHTGPKQLIKIAGKPISLWGIESLIARGIKEIAIVLGENNPQRVIDYYGDGKRWGASFTYIYQGRPLGLAHAIYQTKDFVGSEDFIVYLGDNVVLDGLDKLIDVKSECSILLSRVREPNRFGVAIVNSGKVVKLIEKPKEFVSDLALVGVYRFNNKIFKQIEKLKPSWRGELEITDAIQSLIDNGITVNFTEIEGWWKDTGTPKDLLEANNILLDKHIETQMAGINEGSTLEGRIHLGKNSILKNSIVRGPVCIGDGTNISDSYIGPYSSIGDRCNISRAEVSNALILDEATVADTNLVDSILGNGASVAKSDARPSGTKLIIGEGSKVFI